MQNTNDHVIFAPHTPHYVTDLLWILSLIVCDMNIEMLWIENPHVAHGLDCRYAWLHVTHNFFMNIPVFRYYLGLCNKSYMKENISSLC